jgi:nucleoside-diphosphate-sugar epimerase
MLIKLVKERQMVLITGGMGFIGLHTARKFLDAGEKCHRHAVPDVARAELFEG